MRRIKFDTIVTFRNLLVKQISKDRKKPLKTAKDVLLLIDSILYDYRSFECFYDFGDNVNVHLHIDDKNKIQKISISA